MVSESESDNELRNTLNDCVEQSGKDAFGRQLSNTFKCRLESDNSSREFFIYIPEKYTSGRSPAALLLSLHGYTSTARTNLGYSGFQSLAEGEGFLVVYPQGSILPTTQETHWNVGGWTSQSTTDDIDFIDSMIDYLDSNYLVNLNRIYSTGMSNGGYMSLLLACQLSEKIAAVASVTGSMTPETYDGCNAQHPIPTLQIHGTNDSDVPYNGVWWSLSIEDVISYWVNYNNCNINPTITSFPDLDLLDGSTVDHFVYSDCDNDVTTEHIKVLGGNHTWPGSAFDLPGLNTNQDINASILVWQFFSKYDINGLINPPMSISEHIKQKEVVKIIDLLGRESKNTNQPLFYIYDDGTIEKRIIIE